MDENKKMILAMAEESALAVINVLSIFTIYVIYVVGKMIYYKIKNLILAVGQML